MKCLKINIVIAVLFLTVAMPQVFAAWEVTVSERPAPGYIRFDWAFPGYFYLYDNYGEMQYVDSTSLI